MRNQTCSKIEACCEKRDARGALVRLDVTASREKKTASTDASLLSVLVKENPSELAPNSSRACSFEQAMSTHYVAEARGRRDAKRKRFCL